MASQPSGCSCTPAATVIPCGCSAETVQKSPIRTTESTITFADRSFPCPLGCQPDGTPGRTGPLPDRQSDRGIPGICVSKLYSQFRCAQLSWVLTPISLCWIPGGSMSGALLGKGPMNWSTGSKTPDVPVPLPTGRSSSPNWEHREYLRMTCSAGPASGSSMARSVLGISPNISGLVKPHPECERWNFRPVTVLSLRFLSWSRLPCRQLLSLRYSGSSPVRLGQRDSRDNPPVHYAGCNCLPCPELPDSGDRGAEWRRVCMGDDQRRHERQGYRQRGMQLRRR